MLRSVILPCESAEEHLTLEEAAFASLKDLPLALFYTHQPCIIAGRHNKLEDWVNLDAAAIDTIPILRRVSGGGTVYHDMDTLCYCFLIPRLIYHRSRRGQPPMDFFRAVVAEGVLRLNIPLLPSRISDLTLNGRKVSGNAAKLTKYGIMFHGTMLLEVDYGALERYLPIPPDRPGISHRQFVTSLRAEGFSIAAKEISQTLSTALEEALFADNNS
jgi:lipoate-protein ligase A